MKLDLVIYAIAVVFLLLLELGYFRIAEQFKIIDRPNERSSHKHPTIRGGGIIFILAAFLFSALNDFSYPFLMMALLLSGVVSFMDDIRSMPSWLRFFIQLVSGLLILYESSLMGLDLFYILIILVLIIGVVNAYNFMDGINGITGFYSLAILLPLLLTEENEMLRDLELFTLLSAVVFLFFNARKRARCFAGDVGSVGMAMIILFLLINRIYATHNFNYIGFLLLYGVDTILTIIQRLYIGENIFKPHRKHLFQLFSNEFKIPHLVVGAGYGLIQLGVNFYIVAQSSSALLLFGLILITGLAYIFIKVKSYQWIRRSQ